MDHGESSGDAVPAAVTLHIWGCTRLPAALRVVSGSRVRARRISGVTFAKVLGTGSGRTFTPSDTDLGHWALLLCWADIESSQRFIQGSLARSWDAISHERASFVLRPLVSRGTWSGRTPFGEPVPHRPTGPIAALTRARIKTRHWPAFWQSVPPVSLDAHAGSGLRFALGIGEAPVGLQGTFSIWDSMQVLNDFAYRRDAHRRVVARTAEIRWYAEELFARFAVESAVGRYRGTDVSALCAVSPVHPGSL